MENAFRDCPRVFVVDDEEDIAKMIAVVLQMKQFDAIAYSEPLKALQDADAAPPDYLVSDVAMPGMSGIDLALAMQAKVPSCKVLLFTGDVGAPVLVEEARNNGVHDFALLMKPVHPMALVGALAALRSKHSE
jgi:FixJ family two-component response regulator